MNKILKPKNKPYYVNNKEFSEACDEYVRRYNASNSKDVPVPDYIAECFMKLCKGLASKYNFSGYTYKDEMISDGLENCLRAIKNYKITTDTRTQKPNAFGYFTQCVWFAFLRRIAKEKKNVEIRDKYIMNTGVFDLIVVDGNKDTHGVEQHFIEDLKKMNAQLTVDKNGGNKEK